MSLLSCCVVFCLTRQPLQVRGIWTYLLMHPPWDTLFVDMKPSRGFLWFLLNNGVRYVEAYPARI